MLFYTFIFTSLLIIYPIQSHETDNCPKAEDKFSGTICDHKDPGTQIQCIGSQLRSKQITEFEAEMQLQDVISQFHSDNTYYSLGVQIGTHTALVAARQTHYTFDSTLALKLNPYTYNRKLVLHVYEKETSRPIIIFTNSNIDADEFPKTALRFNVPRGTGKTSVVYNLPVTTTELLDKGTDACDRFARWNQLIQLSEYSHVAILMPMKYYCRHTAHTYADVIIGEYDIMEVRSGLKTQKYLRSTWHISRHTQRGSVPDIVKSDF